jgi:hypothetical protein
MMAMVMLLLPEKPEPLPAKPLAHTGRTRPARVASSIMSSSGRSSTTHHQGCAHHAGQRLDRPP